MADPTSVVLNQAGAVQQLTDLLSSATLRLRLTSTTGLTASSVIGDITANEISGNGYAAGGIVLTDQTDAAWDATDGRAEATATGTLTATGALTFRQGSVTVNNGTDYIYDTFTWAADESLTNGDVRNYTVKFTLGPQGATVNITDS